MKTGVINELGVILLQPKAYYEYFLGWIIIINSPYDRWQFWDQRYNATSEPGRLRSNFDLFISW